MVKEIYDSMFLLSYSNKEIERNYQEVKEQKIKNYIRITTSFLFFASLGGALLNTFFLNSYNVPKFRVLYFTSYITSFIYIILLGVSLFTKNIFLIRALNYINYFFLMFICINFRDAITNSANFTCIFFFILLSMEMILRLQWVITGILSFIETFILIVITMAIGWTVYPPTMSKSNFENSMLEFASYSIALFKLTSFSYFFEMQQRRAFYCNYITDKKANWLSCILENMKSGFLSIKNGEITYVNSFLVRKFEKSKFLNQPERTVVSRILDTNIIFKNQDNEKEINIKGLTRLLENVFKMIESDSIENISMRKNIQNFKSQIAENQGVTDKSILSLFAENISNVRGINDFILVGDFFLELEGEDCPEIYFEFFCRYNKSDQDGYELDCLFNDVTRTKLNEKSNAEFKYKALFLSKVAHEFKNPLICISELINQVDDMSHLKSNSNSTEANLMQNLVQIKSMSNFLLVLVKDLDYFSQTQLGRCITLEKKEMFLPDLLSFCDHISNSLLKKNNKELQIKFIIKIDAKVPDKLVTDELRLKQILVNLISNAIKFTLYGEIALEISLEQRQNSRFVKFLIRDTGIGMKEEEKKNIFKPFSKGVTKYNEYGTGLGLSIVADISSQLGERVKFTSEYNKGSSFWICLKLDDNENDVNSDSPLKGRINILDLDSTYKKIDYHDDYNNNSNEHTKILDYNLNTVNYLATNVLIPKRIESNNNISDRSINCQTLTNQKNKNIESLIKKKAFENYSLNDFLTKDISSLRVMYKNESDFSDDQTVSKISETKFLNIIVTDDESLTRQSIIRILKMISSDLNIKINILEAQDGIESIFLVYKCITQGIKISMIFSDETMNYITGSRSAEIIKEFLIGKNLSVIPFYLVTAINTSINTNNSITQILTKPLSKNLAIELISSNIVNNSIIR